MIKLNSSAPRLCVADASPEGCRSAHHTGVDKATSDWKAAEQRENTMEIHEQMFNI